MPLFDPNDAEARNMLMLHHPLVTRDFLAVTPTIEWAYGVVRDSVWLRMSSIYFCSVPRMGKTHCAIAMVSAIKDEFSDRYIAMVTADVTGSEGIVLSLAKAIGIYIRPRQTMVSIRDLLLTHIACELASTGGDQFVLILDEMQKLRLVDYQHLQVIQNRLRLDNISMITIGFSQTEIDSVRTSLVGASESAVVARFLSEKVDFLGCIDANWLRDTLIGFDEVLKYPAQSDCSYTNFFLPLAFSAGFRLHHSAGLIYDQAKKVCSATSGKTIPIAHLFSALSYLLVTARVKDSANFKLEPNLIDDAIRKSGMGNFSSLMSSSRA